MNSVASVARPQVRLRGVLARREAAECVLLIAGAVVAVLVVPEIVGRQEENVLYTLFTVATLAQAWNIIGGFGGQFSLGNAAFVGVGAYTTAVLMIHTGLPVAVVVLASGVLASGFAVLVAFGLLRLRGVYFAIGSLAVALAVYSWMVNWDYTGATQGLSLPLQGVLSEHEIFQVTAAVLALATAVAWSLRWSPFGLRLQAVRDDEDAATVAGINAARSKMIAFAISAFLTGVIGSLFAMHQFFIEPTSAFSLNWTIDMIVMTIVGGIGTVIGPLLGATVVYYGIEKQLESHADVSAILTGILLVVVVRFAPGGIWGLIADGARAAAERVPVPANRRDA